MSNRLPANDWRRVLHRNDEVTWNDPDAGLCSRKGQILKISYRADDSAAITWMDGTTTEVLLRELS